MGILDSIKGERKLSFNHWRYRLLHWCFNVKNPDPKDLYNTTGGMPKFLYTHYCPLFHLTNLIAIFSPLILFIKVVCVVVGAVIAGLRAVPWDKIGEFFAKFKPKPDPNKKKPAEVIPPKATKGTERVTAVNLICDLGVGWDFESFWNSKSYHFNLLDRQEVEAIFNEYMPKIIEAHERAKKRKEELRKMLIFWTNFSRVFIKWFLNVFYVALALVALYLVVLAVPYIWDGLCWFGNGIYWLFTDGGSVEMLLFVLKITGLGLLFGGIIFVLAKVGFLQRFWEGMCHGCSKLAPPFYVVPKFFAWVGGGFTAAGEFVKMFYEENCPPITLVSPEEAKVEEIATGEKEGS